MPDASSADDAGSSADAGRVGDAAPVGDGAAEDAALADAAIDDAAPLPRFAEAASYTATISGHADPADVYYPLADGGDALPVALLLQGANVPRANYARYARRVARYGFIVVVPDHAGLLGLFPEQQQVPDTLAFMASENTREGAPIRGRVDVATLVLLGHSYGGVVALGAVSGTCSFPFCSGSFTRPGALRAAALYGTNYGASPPALPHGTVGVALLQGAQDGVASLDEAEATYAALASPPRALFNVDGANHYGLCDVNNPSGAAADSSAPTLPQDELVDRTADLAARFLRAVALGDDAATTWLRASVAEASGFSLALDL